jgi:acetyltransferase-like isoleucine patch superfamily enzyme
MKIIERLSGWKRPVIKHNELTVWNWMVQNPEGLVIGEKSDIGAFTYINAESGVIIGEEVQIGSHCSIYSVSTIDNKKGKVIIEKHAKIGSHTTIMPGVMIGENAIVGAHSFVNKSIPSNSIAFGVPAKIKKV